MVNDLDAGVLFIVESAGERIAEHQDIDARALKILPVIQEQLFRVEILAGLLRLSLGLLPGLLRLPLPGLLPGLSQPRLLLRLALPRLLRLPLGLRPGLLLRLSLPGLLGLCLGQSGGQRNQRSHDEGGTGAEVHADDPYPAEGAAVVLSLLERM
jgi:hypothetical protein